MIPFVAVIFTLLMVPQVLAGTQHCEAFKKTIPASAQPIGDAFKVQRTEAGYTGKWESSILNQKNPVHFLKGLFTDSHRKEIIVKAERNEPYVLLEGEEKTFWDRRLDMTIIIYCPELPIESDYPGDVSIRYEAVFVDENVISTIKGSISASDFANESLQSNECLKSYLAKQTPKNGQKSEHTLIWINTALNENARISKNEKSGSQTIFADCIYIPQQDLLGFMSRAGWLNEEKK